MLQVYKERNNLSNPVHVHVEAQQYTVKRVLAVYCRLRFLFKEIYT